MKNRIPMLAFAACLSAGFALACDQPRTGEQEREQQQQGQTEEGAPTGTSEQEIEGWGRSENDLGPISAETYVDEFRLGHQVDQDNKVAENQEASTFRVGQPIHASMRIGDAPEGSEVKLNLKDAQTGQSVWSDQKPAKGSKEYLSFEIPADKLQEGTYTAEVLIGDEAVADTEFDVKQQNVGGEGQQQQQQQQPGDMNGSGEVDQGSQGGGLNGSGQQR